MNLVFLNCCTFLYSKLTSSGAKPKEVKAKLKIAVAVKSAFHCFPQSDYSFASASALQRDNIIKPLLRFVNIFLQRAENLHGFTFGLRFLFKNDIFIKT